MKIMKKNAKKYTEILEDVLLLFAEKHNDSLIPQQDNAPIHAASLKKSGLVTVTLRLCNGRRASQT